MSPGKEEKQSGCCLLHSCCLCGPLPSHGSMEGWSQWKNTPSETAGWGHAPYSRLNTRPVSRIRPCFLHTPQPNFLWISDHLLFPIMLLFTLSIWRIQMLNEKRERRKGGGEEFHFAWRIRYSKCHPTRYLRSIHQRGRGWLNYLCVRWLSESLI